MEPERPILMPDPLESEPESDEEDRTDGIFSPQFVKSTGVHVYMKTCRDEKVVPVQQFISMLDHEVVSLKHRGVGSAGGKAIFECLRHNKHIQALDMEDNQLGLNVDVDAGALRHVCAALEDNDVLTNLDLSYNNFAGRGCAQLAEALQKNTKVRMHAPRSWVSWVGFPPATFARSQLGSRSEADDPYCPLPSSRRLASHRSRRSPCAATTWATWVQRHCTATSQRRPSSASST